MGEFQLDTSGFVTVLHPRGADVVGEEIRWPDFTPFAQGYTAALFATRITRGEQRWTGPLSEFAGFSDLAPETVERIREDCAALVGAHEHLNRQDVGAVFWHSRQKGNQPRFPPQTISIDDNGKVRLTDSAKAEGRS